MANGSRTIRVIKRDGTTEHFDPQKLTGAIWRALPDDKRRYDNACQLAEAIELYLLQRRCRRVSSAAILEMMLKALGYVGLDCAARAAEAYRQWRALSRSQLRIRHEGGRVTLWEKGWLCEFACRSWQISRSTGRILADAIELELIQGEQDVVDRSAVLEGLNRLVLAYGLADAVPVRR